MIRGTRPWWYGRLRRAYRKHGAAVSLRETWEHARIARGSFPTERLPELGPIRQELAS